MFVAGIPALPRADDRRGEEPCSSAIFALSDSHYRDNRRLPNQFIADIVDEALYAEQVGLNSAWIGEHHFSTLGVPSCPDLTLAYIAARTQRIRLAPAITVLPLHHPIRVAEAALPGQGRDGPLCRAGGSGVPRLSRSNGQARMPSWSRFERTGAHPSPRRSP